MSAQVVAKHLADELRDLGLLDMARRAVRGHYSDFCSPLAAPKITLAEELNKAAIMETRHAEHRAAILALRKRVMDGEFDG